MLTNVFEDTRGHYPFRRDFYQDIKDSISSRVVTFLLGPRKCGKTVCMFQLNEDISCSYYYNLKSMKDPQRDNLMLEICNSIQKSCKRLYLVDEITYLEYPEIALQAIYDSMSKFPKTDTRVVFTGSQSVALKSWADRYFCGCAGYVYADFMNYDEWLRYSHSSEATEESYLKFLGEIDTFYDMPSIKEYLEGCLSETVISNEKALNVIFNNDCSGLTVDLLLDTLYAALINLHNNVGYSTFVNKGQFKKTLKFMLKDIKVDAAAEDQIDFLLCQRYNSFKGCTEENLRRALVFLYSCGLITFTTVGSDLKEDDIAQSLLQEDYRCNNITHYKDRLFKEYNIFIRHPMFYMALVKYVIKEVTPKMISRSLLGSVVECHVRALLPQRGQYEFRALAEDGEQVGIDYVNPSLSLAVEITVYDNHRNSFDLLRKIEAKKPVEVRNNYSFVMLTQSIEGLRGDVMYVPYYKYIQLLSSKDNPYRLCT